MQFVPVRRVWPSLALSLPFLFVVASPGAAIGGDVDDATRFSRLELSGTGLGQPLAIDLRTANSGAPALLMLSPQITPFNPDGPAGIPWLRTFGPNTGFIVVPTDAAGRFFSVGTMPNDPTLLGATGYMQALSTTTDGRPDVTNVAALTVGQGPGFSYVDRSANVPLAGQINGVAGGAAQDLDLDGDPDLVLATGISLHVFRNDGGFTFTEVTSTAVPLAAQVDTAVVELIDANGDRRIDIFVGGGTGDSQAPPLPNLLLRNQGNMVFTVDSNFPSTAGLPMAVWTADLDLDADLDLVIANGNDGVHGGESPDPNMLLVNQGGVQGGIRGHFVADTAFANAAWNSAGSFNNGVCGGDYDNDGDVDLFFARSDTSGSDGTPGQPNVLLRNDGGLAFTDVSASALNPLWSDNSRDARFGDFDRDGLLDLVVANAVTSIQSAQSGIYYRNQGNGTFLEDKANFPQIDESELSIRLGVRVNDVDLDGDLDVLAFNHEFIDFDGSTGGSTGGDDLLFVNQGGVQGGAPGAFQLATGFTKFGIFISADMITADFDLDGDDDVYIPSNGGFFQVPGQEADRLLENTRIP